MPAKQRSSYVTPRETRKSRSRPRSHVRGRSKVDKRRHPDAGDRRPSRRRKGDPIVVPPAVTIPSQQSHQYSKVGQRISVPRVRLHKNQSRLFHKSFSRPEQRCLWVDLCNLLHCVEWLQVNLILRGTQGHKVKEEGE